MPPNYTNPTICLRFRFSWSRLTFKVVTNSRFSLSSLSPPFRTPRTTCLPSYKWEKRYCFWSVQNVPFSSLVCSREFWRCLKSVSLVVWCGTRSIVTHCFENKPNVVCRKESKERAVLKYARTRSIYSMTRTAVHWQMLCETEIKLARYTYFSILFALLEPVLAALRVLKFSGARNRNPTDRDRERAPLE